jgi:hypothetical protein
LQIVPEVFAEGFSVCACLPANDQTCTPSALLISSTRYCSFDRETRQ